MPSERLTGLLSRGTLWAIYEAGNIPYGRPFPADIDAPWTYTLNAQDWAEELDRAAWIEGVKQRLGLITLDDDEEARASRVLLANEDPVWPELEPEDKRTWRRIIPIATN